MEEMETTGLEPVIDGTNSEGNYIMAKQYSPTGLAGFEPANATIKMLCLTA